MGDVLTLPSVSPFSSGHVPFPPLATILFGLSQVATLSTLLSPCSPLFLDCVRPPFDSE